MPSNYKAYRHRLEELESELEDLELLKAQKLEEIEKIKTSLSKRARRYQGTGVRRGNEKLVISRAEIEPYVTKWLNDYRRNGNNGAVKTLSELSKVSTRTIQAIVHGHRVWVSLSTADDLFDAMDISYEIHNVRVVTNPTFIPRVEDCGE